MYHLARGHFALRYDLLTRFTLIALAGVGQSDALEFVFILELPSVSRQIRGRYAAFVHLSAD